MIRHQKRQPLMAPIADEGKCPCHIKRDLCSHGRVEDVGVVEYHDGANANKAQGAWQRLQQRCNEEGHPAEHHAAGVAVGMDGLDVH